MRSISLISVALAALAVEPGGGHAAEGPVPLVFDTDLCGDADDVLALALVHALQSRGACRLVAATVSVDHELSAPFVDAVNTFYGRASVPVGVVGRGGVTASSPFLAMVDERDGEKPRYPHALASGRTAPGATAVLREALAGQPDGSVVVVMVGFATNLARLLDSPPDGICGLTGADLVRTKVRLLSVMAGAFTPIDGNDHYLEYNVRRDVASARAVAARWPSPVVWSGFEVGNALPFPAANLRHDFGYAAHHPVAEAYVRQKSPVDDRPTWDLTSVLYALRPDAGYFDLSPPGTVTVEPDGYTRFDPDARGRHRYLVVRPENVPRVREAFVQLASQPPGRAATD